MKFNPLANNPVMQLISVFQNGGDPSPLIERAIENHPQRDQIKKLVGGKTDQQIMQTAENMCRERGISIDDVLRRMGFTR